MIPRFIRRWLGRRQRRDAGLDIKHERLSEKTKRKLLAAHIQATSDVGKRKRGRAG